MQPWRLVLDDGAAWKFTIVPISFPEVPVHVVVSAPTRPAPVSRSSYGFGGQARVLARHRVAAKRRFRDDWRASSLVYAIMGGR